MQLPLQITFSNMEPSDAIKANIHEKAEKLDHYCDHIMSCRVVVEAPHKHHHQGKLYHIKIDITVPKGEIVVSRNTDQNHAHEDIYVAIRDAFNAATRQLEDYTRQERAEVKHHEAPKHGSVTEIVTKQDYGTIKTDDGRLIYFHRNSVLNNAFDKLKPGSEVRFDEEQGDNGPQASTVRIIGKHHIVE